MGKAVLISIKPKWCELIADGKKTVEVRKTCPKLKTPFKCYIYCTKPTFPHEDYLVFHAGTEKANSFYGGGKVIGEFVCREITTVYQDDFYYMQYLSELAGIGLSDLYHYAGYSDFLYGFHISNLKIYDDPKELSEFRLWNRPECAYGDLGYATPQNCDGCNNPPCHVQRAFQSWGYVEELT